MSFLDYCENDIEDDLKKLGIKGNLKKLAHLLRIKKLFMATPLWKLLTSRKVRKLYQKINKKLYE